MRGLRAAGAAMVGGLEGLRRVGARALSHCVVVPDLHHERDHGARESEHAGGGGRQRAPARGPHSAPRGYEAHGGCQPPIIEAMRDPETPAEWQEAVDCAYACLLLDSARQYQLVEGGPGVDVERCDAILVRGREQQILPKCTGVDEHLALMLMMKPTKSAS